MVCAAVAVITINNNDTLETIEYVDNPNSRGEEILDDIKGTRGIAGWLVLVVIGTFIVEGSWILIRFLNFGLVNFRITIFLAIVSGGAIRGVGMVVALCIR